MSANTHSIGACVADYDVEAEGDSLGATLRAYAVVCRNTAAAQQKTVDALLAEAALAERMAEVSDG
jgi:hypothetical protein